MDLPLGAEVVRGHGKEPGRCIHYAHREVGRDLRDVEVTRRMVMMSGTCMDYLAASHGERSLARSPRRREAPSSDARSPAPLCSAAASPRVPGPAGWHPGRLPGG